MSQLFVSFMTCLNDIIILTGINLLVVRDGQSAEDHGYVLIVQPFGLYAKDEIKS